jgi:cell division protein FtsX
MVNDGLQEREWHLMRRLSIEWFEWIGIICAIWFFGASLFLVLNTIRNMIRNKKAVVTAVTLVNAAERQAAAQKRS